MNSYEQKIFDILRDKRLLSSEQADEIARKLSRVDEGLETLVVTDPNIDISSQDILEIKAEVANLPAFPLKEDEYISAEVLGSISEEAARQYKIVPIEKKDKILKVGIVNPEDYKARDAVRFIALGSDLTPELYVISEEAFHQVLGQYRTFRGQIKEALSELEKEAEAKDVLAERKGEGATFAGMIKEAPITKVVAVILKHAVEGKASDVHIEPIGNRTRVRFRVHGKLYTSLFLPEGVHPAVVSRIKILASLRLDEMRMPQNGRFSTEISGRLIDFRVSTFPSWNTEKVVLRVLDPENAIKNLPDLGLVGRTNELVEEAMRRPFGLVLISGPTGSGKSTTLYAVLSAMDKEAVNAVSLEDPIEYHIEGVSQSQIHHNIGYTFASGLRNVLRQDPDVIMVGEIRDSETANLATHASLTGHLVLSTIHTNNAIGVIPRLLDMEVPNFLIPSSLTLMIAQRLVARLCPSCKVSYKAPVKIAQMIHKEVELLTLDMRKAFDVAPEQNYELWNSPGCDKCGRKGTLGRIGLFEGLLMTNPLKQIVYEGVNEILLEEEARRQGMVSLLQDGILKALRGEVAIEEVLRVVQEYS